jgi:hypothetical protein
MVLKEAYQYSNALSTWMSECAGELRCPALYKKIRSEHNKSVVNPDAKDEVIESTEYMVDKTKVSVHDMIETYLDIMRERETLMTAIEKAKASVESVNLDVAFGSNKDKRSLIATLIVMNSCKDTEEKTKAQDYKFNVNGEQVKYFYDVTSVTTVSFDRHEVKGLIKKLTDDVNATSTKIDQAEISTVVDYSAKWSIADSLDDIILTHVSNGG